MDNLLWGLQMTVLGMGLVFGLLALLWGLLTLVLRFDKGPAPAPAGAVVEVDPETAPTHAQGMDPVLVAAIMMATLTHRAVRRREAAPEMRSHWPGSLLYASRWVGAGRARQNQSWHRGGSAMRRYRLNVDEREFVIDVQELGTDNFSVMVGDQSYPVSLAGDLVTRGQQVAVPDAMKMHNLIGAPRAGTIAEVCVAAGQAVGHGDPIVRFAEG